MAWGRTDCGVHASGAVVTLDLSLDEVKAFSKRASTVSLEGESDATKTARFLRGVRFACNSGDVVQKETRVESIVIISVAPVTFDFDARFSALWKRYVYYICAGGGHGPNRGGPFVWSRYSWKFKQPLDLDLMVSAAELLSKKEHNFEWLSLAQPGELRDPRRRVQLSVELVPMGRESSLSSLYFLQQSETAAVYKITGTCDMFLYRMMRRIVAVLVAVGRNIANLDLLKRCVNAHDIEHNFNQEKIQVPRELRETAPAKGLCLEHIEYKLNI